MKQFKITDQKAFTAALFLRETFDSFLLSEATFKTFQTIHLDGVVCKEYYEDNKEDIPPHITWGASRPISFQIIKGKQLPASFKIILCANEALVEQITSDLPLDPAEIDGLFLNILYHDHHLTCTCGVSVKTFTLDRDLPNAWDLYIQHFLTEQQLSYDIL